VGAAGDSRFTGRHSLGEEPIPEMVIEFAAGLESASG
jgi:hypothetical protein